MSNPGSCPLWYRVADLRVRLRAHLDIHRHRYRGRLWYVVQDRASHRYYRFGPRSYRLIRELDGRRSVDEIREALVTAWGEDVPAEDEIVKLLADLHANDLIQCDVSPDVAELFARYQKARKARWRHYVKGPLLIRIPLADPDLLLGRLDALTARLPGRLWLLIWFPVVLLAGILAASHWSDIGRYWESRALAPYNLLLIVLTYPVVKGLHELAHALAVKRWGGEVHEMGIMLLIFMPLPYVDASSCSVFREKHKRMMVGAAGILTELFLAALATFVWLSVETGTVRDIAYDVMLIGGISTVLFNGNPLLRFDGYYVLADSIEIPNLAQRANRYYGYLVQKYLFGLSEARSPVNARGERPWFAFYGLTSTLYRLFILVTIVLFLAEKYRFAGVLLGVTAVFLQVVHPLARQIRFVVRSPILRSRRTRALSSLAGVTGLAFVFLVYVPLPASTYAQGIVWLPEHAHVRAGTEGFIARLLAEPQTRVPAGTALFEVEDPLLQAEVTSLEWELLALRARHAKQVVDDRVEASLLEGQIERLAADLAQARAKSAESIVRSPATGTFLVPGAHHLPGRFARKGEVLGYVTDLSGPSVRAGVDQADIALVREQTRKVEVRLADRPGETFLAALHQQFPSGTATLPSPALGSAGGGLITVDAEDPEGVTATEEVFLVDIVLSDEVDVRRVGTRVHIRFEHDSTPLADRLRRALRQLLLSRFTV